MRSILLLLFIVVASAVSALCQNVSTTETGPIRSSGAYAEVLLRRTELQADIEAFTADYTEENPKVVDARFELGVLTKDLDRIYSVRPSETAKLTQALGKLIVRRAAIETDLARLLRIYNKDHPDVKRTKRRAEIFATAIKEILG